MYKTIKSLIPSGIRNQLIKTILDKRYSNIYEDITAEKKKFDKKAFILGAPEHGNLGDHAIIHAEKAFFSSQFPEYKVFEIPFKMVTTKISKLKELIDRKDVVVVMGGGYMGTLWPKNEEFIRQIINSFPDNKIVVFPQTAYYEDSEFGENYLLSSTQTYNSHDQLYLAAREKATYQLFEDNYKNANNLLTPDIGLFLDETKANTNRDGILICLRKDIEKVTNDSFYKHVISLGQKHNMSTKSTDTVLNRPIFEKDRNSLLEKKLNEFRSSKIVVTDRLHGMIFATITGTPCIALDNKTGKVKGVYEWIKDHNYVTLLENIEDLEEKFDNLIKLEDIHFDVETLRAQFTPLIQAIAKKETSV